MTHVRKIITFFNKIPIEQRKSYGRHSKGNAKDFGYHNWNNSRRDGNPLGIARPGMIPGSNKPIPKLCSTSLSEFGRSTSDQCNWDSTLMEVDEYSKKMSISNVMHLI